MSNFLVLHSFSAAALLAFQLNARPGEPFHQRTEFRFSANLPYQEAFPLFGAWQERLWAPDWKPQFLYPTPPADVEGAVFTVHHGSHSSVWMLTRFDPAAGRVQYAVVINARIMTRIEISLKPNGTKSTAVHVAYEWTALDPGAEEHIKALAKSHANAAAEWSAQINAYASQRKSRQSNPCAPAPRSARSTPTPRSESEEKTGAE